MVGRLTLLALCACAPVQPDLLLITVDTTRADALGCYGAMGNPTPEIDALALRGLRVLEVQAAAPLTLPAHASLMTGLYTDRHGLRENGHGPLAIGIPTLAERVGEGGWATGAFVAAAVLDSTFGLDRGFSVYQDGFEDQAPVRGAVVPQWDGAVVVDRALGWGAALPKERPAFVWVHLYDVHSPRDPSMAARERFPTDPYAAEVAEVDGHVAALLRGWSALHRGDPLVVVVGDHGESNGEHGEESHGWFAYRSTLRVPWILSGPGLPQGQTVDGPHSSVDVAPTILSLLGLPPLAGADGLALSVDRPGAPLRSLYAESFTPQDDFGMAPLRVLLEGPRKAILAPQPELYDWSVDPGEANNLATPVTFSPWAERFEAWEKDRPVVAAYNSPKLSATLQAQLLSLGYVTGPSVSGEGKSWTEQDDPKQAPELPADWARTMNAARSMPPSDGIAELDAFLGRHPRVRAAHALRARALALVGRSEEALIELEGLLTHSPLDAELIAQAAQVEIDLGRAESARARLKPAIGRDSWRVGLRSVLAMSFLAEGRYTDCVASANAALDHAPHALPLLSIRGLCLLSSGNAVDGLTDLRAVLAVDPLQVGLRLPMALSLAESGALDEAAVLLEEERQLRPDDLGVQAGLGMVRASQGDWQAALPLLAPLWERPELGSDPAEAWAMVLEAKGAPLAEAEAARKEAARRRAIGL